MLNAWWAMLHISPPVYFQVMSLCLPTSREFFSLYKVGTFWISTGTVLVRTLYDTFTVKITPLAFTCVVYLVFFSGSVAYLHTKARYGVLALSLYRPKWFEKGKNLPLFLLVLWVPKPPNKLKNKWLWWKFQQVTINHQTSTMHSNTSADNLWKRYDW